jgi:1-acyl-sn-glycerol-3-phosphate acyltransferase
MRALGGFPVQRGARLNAVEQAVERFRNAERLILVMSPEGTRKRTAHWKSGFYHIARGANVPVVLGFLDYPNRTAGIGPTVHLTGDTEADLAVMAAFYADKRGKRAALAAPVRLAAP